MIDHYHNKARYPEPPLRPSAWSGWRRKKDSDDAWQHIPEADARTKGLCYQALMECSELVGGDDMTWEYLILPEGEKPSVFRPGEGRLR